MTLKLSNYNNESVDLFYSYDIKEEHELFTSKDLEDVSNKILNNFLEISPEYGSLVSTYAKKNGLERIAILFAQGKKIKNTWYYFNGEKGSPVQEWIDKLDGKYKVLILSSCNPGKDDINSQKSPILMLNNEYSPHLFKDNFIDTRLFIPKIGYFNFYHPKPKEETEETEK